MSQPTSGSLRATVARGGVVLIIRQIALVSLSLVGILVTTRVVGPQNYGIFATGLSIHTFIFGIAGLGIQAYLIRGSDRLNDRACDIASTWLLTAGLVIAGGEAAVVYRYGTLLGIESAVPILIFMAASLPVQLTALSALARLDRQFKYERVAAVDFGGSLTYYVLGMTLAFAGWGAWALATAWCTQQVVVLLGYHISARWIPRPAWDRHILKDMLGYSLSWAAGNWVWQARSLVNPFIIGNALGVEAVGFVNMAMRLVDILCFTRPIAWRVAMAAFARVQDVPEKLSRAIADGMELQSLVLGPPLVAFAVFGKTAMAIAFGARWLPVFDVFPFLATASFAMALFTLHASALAVYKLNLDVLMINIVSVGIFAVGTYFLVPRIGIRAIGIADVLQLSSLVLVDWIVRKRIASISYLPVLPAVAGVMLALLLSPLSGWAGLFLFLPLVWPDSRSRIAAHIAQFLHKPMMSWSARSSSP